MTSITIDSNAGEVADAIRDRLGELRTAITFHLSRAALAVERAQVRRLSGGGQPYSYPVPVRTGHLRRSTFVRKLGEFEFAVGNTADYAHAVHSGKVREFAGRNKPRIVQRSPRPFLDDAVEDAKPEDIVSDGIVQTFEGGAR